VEEGDASSACNLLFLVFSFKERVGSFNSPEVKIEHGKYSRNPILMPISLFPFLRPNDCTMLVTNRTMYGTRCTYRTCVHAYVYIKIHHRSCLCSEM
jgi:hypothetical protein